ncbi:flagellar FlbD family protein [bacterium]|nr:MAG: Flagellar protein (FlbD) [Candidatus Hinthialibacteria bacterium OLB16]MCK6496530.1 flagellar FlbD family protein [bacterium]NUP92116.1 flagellar FlbD family protein [Candidatus Omnitrophota bacterium]
MIRLTRLNGKEFVINAELIETLDESPDTIITLLDGKKFVVKENFNEIIRRVLEYRRLCRLLPQEEIGSQQS